MGLFESHAPVSDITIMVQEEVAERMQTGPGTKDYGALSLAVQYYAKPETVLKVSASCFMPRPNVGSAVIRLTRFVICFNLLTYEKAYGKLKNKNRVIMPCGRKHT